jgi:hypothetical protein
VNKKIIVLLALLAAVAFGFYVYLGGLGSAQVTRTTSKPLRVAGRYYAGPAEGEALGKLFQQAAKARESKQLPGTLTNIYYNNPEERGDTIRAFIGVAIAQAGQTLPPGYEERTFPGGKAILEVTSSAHYLLAPNKIYPALFAYLQENKVRVKEQYLEQFPEGGPARVQVEILP